MKTKCDSCIGPTSSEQATVYCLYIHFRTLSGHRISKYNTYLHWSCTISLPFRSSKLQLVVKSFHCRMLTRLGVCSHDASDHSAQDQKCVVEYICMHVSNFIAIPCVQHLICLVRIFSFAANWLACLPTSNTTCSLLPCLVKWCNIILKVL